MTLALSLPLSYYLTLRKKGLICWVYRAQMLLCIGTTFLTASRGGTFCMMIALSLILWTLPSLPMRNRMGIVAVLIATVIAAVALVPATSWKRLGSAAAEVSQGTLNSRTVLWKAGLNEFRTRSFGGIGAGAYPEASAKVIGRRGRSLQCSQLIHLGNGRNRCHRPADLCRNARHVMAPGGSDNRHHPESLVHHARGVDGRRLFAQPGNTESRPGSCSDSWPPMLQVTPRGPLSRPPKP